MIEVLQDMPQGVAGIRVSGRVRGDDLRAFKPHMEDMLKSGEIRIVEVIASDYEGFGPGGLIEDLKLGFGALLQHHSAFRRIAIVTDKDWVAPIRCTHWHGWSLANLPCSASTSSTEPRNGPPTDGRSLPQRVQSSERAGRSSLVAKTAAWVRRSMPSLASRRET